MKCKHCGQDSFKREGHVLLSHPPQFECYDCTKEYPVKWTTTQQTDEDIEKLPSMPYPKDMLRQK